MFVRADDSLAASRALIVRRADEGQVPKLAKEPPQLVRDVAEYATAAGVSGFGGSRSGALRRWWCSKDALRELSVYNDDGE